MKFKFGEINIICKDLKYSLYFYSHILNFKMIERDNGAIRLKCDHQYVLLLPVAEEPLNPLPYCQQPAISFDLQVEDLKATVEYLKSYDIVFEKEWEAGCDSIHIRDPDGLVIEILESSD